MLNNATTINNTLNVSGITTLNNKTIIKGVLNVHNRAPYAANNQTLNNGYHQIHHYQLMGIQHNYQI